MSFKINYKTALVKYMISTYLTEDINSNDKRKIRELIDKELKRKESQIIKTIIKSVKKESEIQDHIYDLIEKAMTEFYRMLWTKKEFWIKAIRNKGP